jgi:hypothetical protein
MGLNHGDHLNFYAYYTSVITAVKGAFVSIMAFLS